MLTTTSTRSCISLFTIEKVKSNQIKSKFVIVSDSRRPHGHFYSRSVKRCAVDSSISTQSQTQNNLHKVVVPPSVIWSFPQTSCQAQAAIAAPARCRGCRGVFVSCLSLAYVATKSICKNLSHRLMCYLHSYTSLNRLVWRCYFARRM